MMQTPEPPDDPRDAPLSDPTVDASDTPCPNPDDPAYVALWDRYTSVQKANQRKEIELQTRFGPNAQLPKVEGMEMRMELAIMELLPSDSVARMRFEVEWQELIQRSLEQMHNAILQQIKEQEREAKSMRKGGGGLIVPGKGLVIP